MDVDASFAEYVSARWSMLYRLAVLLAGEDADELTQAALARAYVSWRQVQEAASADALVKEILARTAVTLAEENRSMDDASGEAEPRAAAPEQQEPGVRDREELWSRLIRLSSRERAVVVLAHYESLSDTEIAHALRSSLKSVRSDAAAGVAILTAGVTTDVTKEDLCHELAVRADEAEVPLPPVKTLLSRGREERRRRVRHTLGWSAAAAAGVVVVVAVASLVQGDESGPSRSSPDARPVPASLAALPVGDPKTDVPYSVGARLHVGSGRALTLDGDPSAITQALDRIYVEYPTGRVVAIDPTTQRTDPVTELSAGGLAVDPEGRRIAWLGPTAGPAEVVLRAAAPGTGPEAHQQFPVTPVSADNPFVINGINAGGELIASMPAGGMAWVWDTNGREVTEIDGLGNGQVRQVTWTEVVVSYPPSHFGVGELQDGAFLLGEELVAQDVDVADPFGSRIVFSDLDGEIRVQGRLGRNSSPIPDVFLRLPQLDAGFTSVRWEDADHVLLDVSDESVPDGALVRCDVDDGSCEILVRFGGLHILAR
jgi:DNA-directed RNA polymerase specialized sigma24 family protein